MPRFASFRVVLRDSNFQKIKVDSIRSNPNIDSISGDIRFTGSPTIDGKITVDTLTGNIRTLGNLTVDGSLSVDSVTSAIRFTAAVTTDGVINADSVNSTKKVKCSGVNSSGDIAGTTGTFSSTISTDSLYSTKGVTSAAGIKGTIGTFSSTITADSLNSTKKIKCAGINSSGDIAGTTATLSSTLTGDSIYIARGMYVDNNLVLGSGISATSGTVTVDSLYSTKGVTSAAGLKGTIATLSSTATVDSLYSTKGITTAAQLKGATLNTSGTATVDSLYSAKGVTSAAGLKGTTGSFSSTVTVDSLRSTKGISFGAGISATTGTFSSTATVDSLYSTKGVTSAAQIKGLSVKSTSGSFQLNSGSGNAGALTFYKTVLGSGSIQDPTIFADGSSGGFRVTTGGVATVRLIVDSLGNTGIRNAAPTKAIDITGAMKADTFYLGTSKFYDTATFPCTVTVAAYGFKNLKTVNARYVKIGESVTVQFKGELNDTCNDTTQTEIYIRGFPASIQSTTGFTVATTIPIYANDAYSVGIIRSYWKRLYFGKKYLYGMG